MRDTGSGSVYSIYCVIEPPVSCMNVCVIIVYGKTTYICHSPVFDLSGNHFILASHKAACVTLCVYLHCVKFYLASIPVEVKIPQGINV